MIASQSQPNLGRTRLVALPNRALAEADDATLAVAAARGDLYAAAMIWDRLAPRVRRLLQRTLGPGHGIEALVQATFRQVCRRLGALRDPHALRHFVVGVAVRVAASELARRRRRRLFGWMGGALPPAETGVSDAGAGAALSRLYATLDRLGARARLVFTLHHFEGMPLGEIARLLGVSERATAKRLARAQARVLGGASGEPWPSGGVEELDRFGAAS